MLFSTKINSRGRGGVTPFTDRFCEYIFETLPQSTRLHLLKPKILSQDLMASSRFWPIASLTNDHDNDVQNHTGPR